MDNYYKSVAEARLKKFYSVYNQAILLAEAKYGPKESWYQDPRGVDFDDDGNAILETNEIDKWFSKYLVDFMVIKKKALNQGNVLYYLSDGSQFEHGAQNTDGGLRSARTVIFYPFGNYEQCNANQNPAGSCKFYFMFYPLENNSYGKYHYQKGLEPFMYEWDGNDNSLKTGEYGCRGNTGGYCTAIIQRNGWKVPKNYPKKIHP